MKYPNCNPKVVETIIQDYLDECWPNRIPQFSHIATRLGYHPRYFSSCYPKARKTKMLIEHYFKEYAHRLAAYAYQICKEKAAKGEFSVSQAAKLLGVTRCNLTQRKVWAEVHAAVKQGISDGRSLRAVKNDPITLIDNDRQQHRFPTLESAVDWIVSQGGNRSKAHQLIFGKLSRYRSWVLNPTSHNEPGKIYLTRAHLRAIQSDSQWVTKFKELAKTNPRKAGEFADYCLEIVEHLKNREVCN
jgi:hypothetical protein